ncbi:TPA: NAD-dependent epimerase/dehydratase family protein [Candidatus Woesearchaeota archaeon]|nr:MAG: NAD-dependent epimerase/dehydratase [archaeon GW2011_AR11]HIH04914.1 NAD-dependent epimerase/dehydratase family protein [Candidatus Woesearchaeota archaeon]HIH91299.1 NAD-dependent epimerase/dehydratase family protein [Candidatus Woesearchaeota archaeon]HII64196.1 NAD-dependent epimerase/dehydratase family protein [Candidatus Woesearchaeota archaeon]HIJ18401.1 NAD-dependent epimerase/dehydratase family protein [Candidatus Woesearchaeota archaeon]
MGKVLITGATGFIGANLARALVDDHEVYLLLRSRKHAWRIADILDRVQVADADLLDAKGLATALRRMRPECIFHLAAYGAYPRTQTDAQSIFSTNIRGTFNLLQAARGVDYRCFVNTGSSSEYGIKSRPMRESDLLEPNTLYGISKAAATMLCAHEAREQGRPIVTLRPFSAYGYYEEPFRLVPSVILRCLRGEDVPLSSGEQKRDYVFIEDIVEAYRKAMRLKSPRGDVFNLGSGKDVSVREVATAIHALARGKGRLLFGKMRRAAFDTASCWKADTKKTAKVLGWKSRTVLKDGLQKTIRWFRENKAMYGQ